MCVIGEADLFIARLLKRFAVESGLQAAVARAGATEVPLQNPEMLAESFC